MRILMLAPECVAGPYGTPRCVAGRIHGLLRLGHEVTLVTYPFGEDLAAPGLRLVRVWRAPFVRRVPVGPSLAKIVQDLAIYRAAARLLGAEKFDLLHTHEEAAYFGGRLARRAGIPHLYDMHSSIPENLRNFGWRLGPLAPLARALERRLLRRVDGVLAVCPALAELVRAVAPNVPVTVVENAPFDMLTGSDDLPESPDGPPDGAPLYCGGFEPNQGVELVLRALAADARLPAVDFYGGRPEQVAAARKLAAALGVDARARFHGTVPFAEVWRMSLRARALLSPRVCGSNAPSKVYHYLRAGRPIVATDAQANRQALDAECAELAAVDPAAFARALRRVLEDAALAGRLARAARRRYQERYTFEAYLQGLRNALAAVAATTKEDGRCAESCCR